MFSFKSKTSAPQRKIAPADLTVKTDRHVSSTEHMTGKREHVDATTHVTQNVTGDFDQSDQHITDIVNNILDESKAAENVRANHRNFNRMMTLVFAMVCGLAVTYLTTNGDFGHYGKDLAPYSFVITVSFDSLLTFYAWIKHY